MKTKIIKHTMMLLACSMLTFSLSGCWSARELDDLDIVTAIGVDKSEKTDNIILTAQIVKPSAIGKSTESGGSGSSEKIAYWNVQDEQQSALVSFREMITRTGKKLYVSHSQVIIFGNDVAKEGVQRYMDFFLRSHETRPTTLVLVSMDKASDVLDIKPEIEQLPAMEIRSIVKASDITAHFEEVNLQNFASCLLSDTKSAVAPLIGIMEEKGKKEIFVSDMAVFKKDKMVGRLGKAETRGLLWITGKVDNRVMEVRQAEESVKASLEISHVKSSTRPELKDGKITMHTRITADASLSEQLTAENLATLPSLDALQKNISDVIRDEITKAFDKSVEYNADIFGFGEMIHKRYKSEWKQMQARWDRLYPRIVLDIKADIKIRKTDLITRPVLSQGDGAK